VIDVDQIQLKIVPNRKKNERKDRVVSDSKPRYHAFMKTPQNTQSRDFARISDAIHYLVTHREEQPELADVADAAGLAPHHFQRLFTRWAGVSPKKFLQYMTLRDAKQRLAGSASVLDAALDSGLSGPGRLHDLFVTINAATPGDFKARGADLRFRYGLHPSPFGECMVTITDRGVAGVSFAGDKDPAQ
jgi:AraC family transcriptional regulator, regulatory protein of adaptative response / methylated-DNA-[protein]-cysteine methyltransferase